MNLHILYKDCSKVLSMVLCASHSEHRLYLRVQLSKKILLCVKPNRLILFCGVKKERSD